MEHEGYEEGLKDDCCEEARPEFSVGEVRPSDGATLGNALRADEPCIAGTNNANRIEDTVIKQMDFGYLVKAGCQTLCIETKEKLVMLLTAFLNDAQKVRTAHYQGKLDSIFIDETIKDWKANEYADKPVIHVAVVGKTKADIDNYMQHNVFQTVTKKEYYYITEDPEHIFYCHAITKAEHLNGLLPNRVIETHQARENKEFSEIIKTCNSLIQ